MQFLVKMLHLMFPLPYSEYLDTFDASSARSESKIHPQKLFSKPVRIVEKYPAAEGGNLEKKHMVCLNWLLDDKPLDLETELALGFLDHLMLGTPASPLRKILLESGLGDAIVGGGVEDELLQPQFSLGLKGVSEDDIKKVEELIINTLQNLAEEGFDSDAVEASMNKIDFSLRENNTGSFPRGLALMLRSIVSTLCGSCCLPKWCSIAFLPKFDVSLLIYVFFCRENGCMILIHLNH